MQMLFSFLLTLTIFLFHKLTKSQNLTSEPSSGITLCTIYFLALCTKFFISVISVHKLDCHYRELFLF